MSVIGFNTLKLLWHDPVPREETLRRIITERLAAKPPPQIEDCIVASYFFAFRTMKLAKAVEEISYHATIGVKNPPPGSLLANARRGRQGWMRLIARAPGILHVAFPLKMMLQPDGHLTSCDILHTVAGAIFLMFMRIRTRGWWRCKFPERVLRTFPGPAMVRLESASAPISAGASRLWHDT